MVSMMCTKRDRIKRKGIPETGLYLAAQSFIREAEKHPLVRAYVEAVKFAKGENNRADLDRAPAQQGTVADAKRLSSTLGEPDVPHVPAVIEPTDVIGRWKVGTTEDAEPVTCARERQQANNIVYLPFLTPELRACAKACGLTPEAYIRKVLAFANAAVKDEGHRKVILGPKLGN